MMKRVMAVAAVSIVCGAHAAGAVENKINLKADVPAYCEVSLVGGGTDVTKTILITEGHSVDDREFTVSYDVLCNGDAGLKITSQYGGLWRGVPGTIPNFDSVINYTVTTGGTATLSGDAIFGQTASATGFGTPEILGDKAFRGSAVNGTLTVTIKPELNGYPLLAGQYSDVLVVSVIAQ